MDSSDLTPEQAKQIGDSIRPMLRYLDRLKARAERRFLKADPLRKQIEAAYKEVHKLSVELHYLSCPGQTGHPLKPIHPPADER